MCLWARAPPAISAGWKTAATSSGAAHKPDNLRATTRIDYLLLTEQVRCSLCFGRNYLYNPGRLCRRRRCGARVLPDEESIGGRVNAPIHGTSGGYPVRSHGAASRRAGPNPNSVYRTHKGESYGSPRWPWDRWPSSQRSSLRVQDASHRSEWNTITHRWKVNLGQPPKFMSRIIMRCHQEDVPSGDAGTIQCVLGCASQIASRPVLHHLSALFGSRKQRRYSCPRAVWT